MFLIVVNFFTFERNQQKPTNSHRADVKGGDGVLSDDYTFLPFKRINFMCSSIEPWVYALAGVLTFVVLLLGVIFFVSHYKRKAFEQALMSQTWRVKYNDIQFERSKVNRMTGSHSTGLKLVLKVLYFYKPYYKKSTNHIISNSED